ncbi:MAG: serine/threonine-protein kinase [Planctomycetota bacterium]
MADGELWARAFQIVRDIADTLPDARTSAIEQRCAGDVRLKSCVLALLHGERDSEPDDLDGDSPRLWPAIDEQLGLHRAEGSAPMPTISGIELRERLGSGGSGDVYAGYQSLPGRNVAVKVMRAGIGTARAEQRFAREARALASITHQAVAAIYEVSTATLPGGTPAPAIVMELIEGRTLAEAAKPMSIRDAAMLVARIARGVHTAHQRGIIHRDLKPSNVLLTRDGSPKIVDFGVALLDCHTDLSLRTHAGELLGTIGYMSPEQLGSGADDDVADVRTDVYALGLVFYELIRGKPAIDASSGSSFVMLQRIARGELPRLPQGGDAEILYRTATAISPDRRYGSAADLADDLERLAGGRPIQARRASVLYPISLFARRNPVLVGVVGLGLVAVLVLSILTSIGFITASRERDAARNALARATASAGFLRDMLTSPDPEMNGPSVRVVDVLDRSSDLIDSSFADQPLVALDQHRTLGWTYAAISQHASAVPHFERSIELAHGRLDPEGAEFLMLRTSLADALLYTADTQRALEILREASAASERSESVETETRLRVSLSLAEALRSSGDPQAGVDAFQTVLDESESLLGTTHPVVLDALSGLGRSLLDLSRTSESASVFETQADRLESLGRRASPPWFTARGNLALSLASEGRHGEAIELYEAVLEEGPASLGEHHHTMLMIRSVIGDSYLAVGRGSDAIAISQRAIDDLERLKGEGHPDTLAAVSNLAVMLINLDRHGEALPLAIRAHEGMLRIFEPDHPSVMVVLRNHAVALDGIGQHDEAVMIYLDLLDRQLPVLGAEAYDVLVTRNNLSFVLCKLNRHSEGLVQMQAVLAHGGVGSGYPPYLTAAFLRNYARCLIGTGRLDDAQAALHQSNELDPGNAQGVEKNRALLESITKLRD